MINRDAIVAIIKMITEKKGAPCKKTLQKMVYLIEAKGIDLGCDYGIHFYGPYSADLDYIVRSLDSEGILSISYSETEHNISVKDDSNCKNYYNDVVNHIVDTFVFDSPSELELIATALYVYRQNKNENKIEEGVKKIKGSKYSSLQIQKAVNLLKKEQYIW